MLKEQVLGVAIKKINRAPQEHIDKLEKFATATIHEAQKRTGQMKPYLRPIYKGKKVAGSAVTVLLQPGDNWMLHVAMELVQTGDIIIAGCVTENSDGFFGDLLATSAKAKGVKALVIDAGVRDTKTLEEIDFPVWSKDVSIRGTVKNTLGSVNIPIICAGQVINPGDIIVADDDGVCVVPRQNAKEVANTAQKREDYESEKREKFKNGVLGLDLYKMRSSLENAGFKYYDTIEDLRG